MLALNPFIRRRRGEDTERKGGSSVTMEADTGMVRPQIRECWQLPEARGARKDSPLEPVEGAWPTDTLILAF